MGSSQQASSEMSWFQTRPAFQITGTKEVLDVVDQDNTTASRDIKRTHTAETTLVDPPDALDPLRAVCDSPDELDPL
jgi:hypothetical protein